MRIIETHTPRAIIMKQGYWKDYGLFGEHFFLGMCLEERVLHSSVSRTRHVSDTARTPTGHSDFVEGDQALRRGELTSPRTNTDVLRRRSVFWIMNTAPRRRHALRREKSIARRAGSGR